MTISSSTRKAGPFTGNGTATTFPFTFKVFQASDLLVVRLDTSTNVQSTLVLNTDYTVALNQNQNTNPGGSIVLGAVLATGFTLTATSAIQNLQPTDLTNQGGFYPTVINDALDRATIQIQQLQESADRSLKVDLSSTVDATLPAPTANDLIGWDATAQKLVNIDPNTLASVAAYATAYCDVFIGNGITTAWTLTRNPGVLYNLDVSIAGSSQEPGRDYTLSGTTFTMTTPPPIGARIVVKYKEGLPNYSGDSQDVRFIPSGTGAATRSVQSRLRDWVSVKDFGAVGDGSTDDTTAIVNAIAFVGANSGGGTVYFPKGNYVTTATIYVPIGVMLEGTGFASGVLWNGVNTREQGSCIVGKHTGAAIVSFKGAYGGGMRDMSVYGWPTTTPKTGIAVGRASPASCGRHLFERVNAIGYYTAAAWYAIASEESTYVMVHGNVLGGGAKYTFFVSGVDDLSVDGFVSSSNWNANAITGFNLLHQATQDDCAAIRINVRVGTVGWTFTDGFTGVTSGLRGSHVNVHLMDATGDIYSTDFVFENVGSESWSNASPPVQHYLVSRAGAAAPSILNGLVIKNCTPGQTLGGTLYFLYVEDQVTLNGAKIEQPLSTHPSRVYSVTNSDIRLPEHNLIIAAGCSGSIINAKQVVHQGIQGSYVNNLTMRGVAYDQAYSGTGPNDMSIAETMQFTGTQVREVVVQIDSSTSPNKFKWSIDGGFTWGATGVSITAGNQTLTEGIAIKFATTTGHSDVPGDRWAFKVDPVTIPNQGLRFNNAIEFANGPFGGLVGNDDTSYLSIAASKSLSSSGLVLNGATKAVSPGLAAMYHNGNLIDASANGATVFFVVDKTTPATRSGRDNIDYLGAPSYRWKEVYAANATINTSDAREKQQIAELTDAEKRVAQLIKGSIKRFKFNDAVKEKGDNARIHVGVVAQEVADMFVAEGLDPANYALFCYDEWTDLPEIIDPETGRLVQQQRTAGNRFGIRYEELLAFVLSAI